MRNEKGITLIALVITIIVMLILVGVTINLVATGGLFNYARDAKTQTEAKIAEESDLVNVDIEKAVQGEPQIITFYIGSLECHAVDGMRWGDWCLSDYYESSTCFVGAFYRRRPVCLLRSELA